MDNKTFCIVVARYNEDVQWTKQFQNVIIYNKGTKLEDGYNEIILDNVGREGHTYYKYICDHYKDLPDYTIFLQGNPFDHSPNIIFNLTRYINTTNLNIEFEFLSESIITSSLELESTTHWVCKNIHNTWQRIFGLKFEDKESIFGTSKSILDVNFENKKIIFGAGAQFIVSKKNILNNTKYFYKNIVKLLEYSISPPEGYDVERFHKYIFTMKNV